MSEKRQIEESAQLAGTRADIYGLLATVYRRELDSDLLQGFRRPELVEVLGEFGVNLGTEFLEGPAEVLLKDMAVEYARLFLGPGKHISPHESVHHRRSGGDWGRLWGRDTVAVKKIVEAAGLEYREDFPGMPDHISAELELMQALAEREGEALSAGDEKTAGICREAERKFLSEHLGRWAPVFCDKVTAAAELPFYREMAGLTKKVIEMELKELAG